MARRKALAAQPTIRRAALDDGYVLDPCWLSTPTHARPAHRLDIGGVATRRGVGRARRAVIGTALLVLTWWLGSWVARTWQFDAWLIRTWLLVPTAACIALAALPWVVDRTSPRALARLWTAIGVALVLSISAGLFLVFMLWGLGPDCGVVASGAIRGRYLLVALAFGTSTATLPVAIAGRRPATLLVGGIPVATLGLLGLMAAASNEPGWCMF